MSALATGDVWDEEGETMYCDATIFTRGQARKLYAQTTGCDFVEPNVRRVYMKKSSTYYARQMGHDEYFQIVPEEDAEFICWQVS